MSRKRRSYEAGHQPKYLVVIDESPECDRAVYYASRRVARTRAGLLMLLVIEPHDRHQQWVGVADLMRAEAHEAANAVLDRFATRANGVAGITPERVIRDGDKAQEILTDLTRLIDDASEADREEADRFEKLEHLIEELGSARADFLSASAKSSSAETALERLRFVSLSIARRPASSARRTSIGSPVCSPSQPASRISPSAISASRRSSSNSPPR